MAWIMTVRMTERSPIFDFVLPEGARAFVSAGDPRKTAEEGYRFNGTVYSPLVAKQQDNKKLCDAFMIIGFMCVSFKFKTIVESFEPGLHQFFPITLHGKDGAAYDAQYFIFNPCVLVDAYLDVGHRLWGKQPDGMPSMGQVPGATVSAAEIAGHHVWVGGFVGRHAVHISDQLCTRLTKEKVRYLRFQGLAESEVIWRPEDQIPQVMQWFEADPARIRKFIAERPEWVRRHRPNWMKLAN